MALAIGIDIGATKTAYVLATEDGNVLAAREHPTLPQRGTAALLNDLVLGISNLVAFANQNGENVVGVGIGVPGQVNSQEGWVRNAVNLGWQEVHLVQVLQSELGDQVPQIAVAKDASAAVMGEYTWGAGRDQDEIALFTIGSGLGAGLIAAGHLIHGANWNAAEVGHFSLDPEQGLSCVCGNKGCAETIVSGPGLVALTKRLASEKRLSSSLLDLNALNPEQVVHAARQNDSLALAAINELGRQFAKVVAASVALINPGCVIIGGGLGRAIFDFVKPILENELPAYVLPASYRNLAIRCAQLQSSALGASSLVWCSLRRFSSRVHLSNATERR